MTTTADAEPNVLPFTSDEYRTVTDAQPRFARLGGHVSISAEAPDGYPEAGYITNPGSRHDAADWMFWREADGLHAERLADGATCLADDMPDLLDSVIGDWEAAAAQRADKARQSGLRSLPDWLTR